MLVGQCFYILYHLFLTAILQGKHHDTLCKKATLVTCQRVYTTEGQMRRMTTALWTTPVHFPTVWCVVGRRKKQRFTIMKNFSERSPGDRLCGPREQKVWTCSSVTGIYWGDMCLQPCFELSGHKADPGSSCSSMAHPLETKYQASKCFSYSLKSWPYLTAFKTSPNCGQILIS